jgi:hypothetical protein
MVVSAPLFLPHDPHKVLVMLESEEMTKITIKTTEHNKTFVAGNLRNLIRSGTRALEKTRRVNSGKQVSKKICFGQFTGSKKFNATTREDRFKVTATVI